MLPLVHEELRRRARAYMRNERPDHTLQASALVNEAYLRLVELKDIGWHDRAHFFAIAAQLMRRILVDHARSRSTAKRRGAKYKLSIDEALVLPDKQDLDLVALDDALNSLANLDPQKSQIVVLRFFSGLSIEETAEVLRVSPDTVRRHWNSAKAWLHREITRGNHDDA